MKALLVSVVSAAIAGIGAGGFMNLSDDVLRVEPTAQVSAAQASMIEDPGVVLHRVAMGSDTWTAPQPAMPVDYVATGAPDFDEIEAKLAAVEAEVHQKGDAARSAYARLFGDAAADGPADHDAPSPDLAAISLAR